MLNILQHINICVQNIYIYIFIMDENKCHSNQNNIISSYYTYNNDGVKRDYCKYCFDNCISPITYKYCSPNNQLGLAINIHKLIINYNITTFFCNCRPCQH